MVNVVCVWCERTRVHERVVMVLVKVNVGAIVYVYVYANAKHRPRPRLKSKMQISKNEHHLPVHHNFKPRSGAAVAG